MPCKQKDAIDKLLQLHFKYDQENDKSRCEVVDCKSVLKGNKPSALRRHFESVHSSKFTEILEEACSMGEDDENYPLLREKLIQSMVEQVTVDGRSIKSLFDSGFQKSIEWTLRMLAKNGNELNINRLMVIKRIESMSQQVVEEIKNELKGRKFNLLIDIATRHFRSVLGINIQYAYAGEVRLRTIGVITLHSNHTGENIVNHILDLFKKYDVSINQLFAYTSDNGPNVLLAGQLLNAKVGEFNPSEEQELEEELRMQANPAMQVLLDNNYHAGLLETIGDEFKNKGITSVHGVRCGVHTLQLSVEDAIKEYDDELFINQIMGAVKKLRTKNVLDILEDNGFKRPILANDTRWNTVYLMVSSTLNYLVHLFTFGKKTNFSA